jgi:hypothetical protein
MHRFHLPLLIRYPLALLGSIFAIMGFIILTAPDELFISPSFLEIFDDFGQTFPGIAFLIIGILIVVDTLYTGHRWGCLAGLFASSFMILMTIKPAWTGDNPTEIYGINIDSPIAVVGLFIWIIFAALFAFYWWAIGALTDDARRAKLR